MMIVVAMFAGVAPTAVAQTPASDQYQTVPPADNGNAPANDNGNAPSNDNANATANDNAVAPVAVTKAAPATNGTLPFTGGQVSLIALIGLGALALGMVGLAATRRRATSTAS